VAFRFVRRQRKAEYNLTVSKPFADKPPRPVPEIHVPTGNRYSVKSGDTWQSLAAAEGLDPWELIEHNFPGMKEVRKLDPPRATRYVNWYLAEYVGCEFSLDGGKNYAFTSALTRGKGVWKAGHIYLPLKKAKSTPARAPEPCKDIEIPPLDSLPVWLQGLLVLAKVILPSRARCLTESERASAKGVYGESLDYDAIYVSNGIGAQNRPVTTALLVGTRWVVVLNVGPTNFIPPVTNDVLIHELAHAWQSQHHPEPWQYMENCAKSQIQAAAAGAFKTVTDVVVPGSGLFIEDLGDASAYAYIPGKLFGDYGGEQIAQQIEDLFEPGTLSLTGAMRSHMAVIAARVKASPPGYADPENVRSLGIPRYEHEKTTGVVWHS
jgi:hypothetical protein